MSYLQGSVSLRFPFESGGGWSGSRGEEGGAAPWRSGSGGVEGKKWEEEEEEAGWVGLY